MNMAKRAEEGYYGDFTSPLATPKLDLIAACKRYGLDDIVQRVMDGDFDD